MSGESFLDSNIFIYSVDTREPVKKSIANELIRSLVIEGDAVISYQVIQ
jgi:predicted nucleic acid-binding protein